MQVFSGKTFINTIHLEPFLRRAYANNLTFAKRHPTENFVQRELIAHLWFVCESHDLIFIGY
jgi:hypothetical protein